MLVFGLNSVSIAQTTPKQASEKQEKDDDDDKDEKDEKLTAEDHKLVKITPEEARKTALAKVPGTIVEEELEKEKGVIVYSIEIRRADKKVFDVEVNAQTGAIVRIEEEDDDDEDGDDTDTFL